MPRLIVIDNLEDGTSAAVENNLPPFWQQEDGHQTSELWYLETVPTLANLPRMFQSDFNFDLAPGAVRFGHSVFPPFSETKKCFKKYGEETTETTYGKHNTKTIDFLVLTKGKLNLITEKETIHLQPGDCIVQKATVHAWINPGTEPAELVYVMIGSHVPSNYKPTASPSPIQTSVKYPGI